MACGWQLVSACHERSGAVRQTRRLLPLYRLTVQQIHSPS
jgi:hypothetical protein